MLRSWAQRVRDGVRARQRHLHGWAEVVIPGLVLVAAFMVWRVDLSLLRMARLKVFDAYQTMSPRRWDPQVPVRIIDLDDETLARLGQWPWPRPLVAKLLEHLSGGASVVAFDVVFAEADRTSPSELARGLPPALGELSARLRRLPDHDAVLADAIKKAAAAGTQVVMGFVLTGKAAAAEPAHKRGFAVSGEDPLAYLLNYAGAVKTREVLENAAAGNGCINALPEEDGVIRRAALVFRHGGELYPSLALEALRLATEAKGPYGLKVVGGSGEKGFTQHTGIVKLKVGQTIIPTDESGRFWIHFTESGTPRSIPAWKVFEKGFDPARLGGGIVFVGTSAEGLKDQRATPMNPLTPGVELHAQIAEMALAGSFLERPDYADGIEVVFFVLVGLALLFLMRKLGAAWCALLVVGSIAGVSYLSWLAFSGAFFGRRMLFDPVLPSLVVLAVYLASSLLIYLRTEAEKRQVRGAFSRYMSPALVEQLAKDPTRLKLGGEMREMTLMFSDIRGFTTISEQFDAKGLTQFINRYLTPMTQIVLDHQGTIDKYMGDCIMSFWNAPLDDPGHAMNACRAGLAMRRTLKELNEGWKAEAEAEKRKFIPIHAGIGINTGPCCVGNMGSDMRFDYSVLGDDVNLASRLEGQSKSYGVDIVLGPNTRQVAAGLATLELDLIKVKGKTIPVNIYTLLGDEALARDARFKALAERHAAMLAAYRGQRWDEAEGLVAECKAAAEALGLHLDKLYHLYEGRLAACRAEPPAKDWDGVFTATTK